jgi:hypothetical protein
MHVERSIRAMTPQEKQAKREWGTGACQVRGCGARAAYLLLESSPGEAHGADWWQYCCPKHARHFADRYKLELPAAVSRAKVGQDSSAAAGVHAGLS